MSKKIMILSIMALFLLVLLCGCTENSDGSTGEKSDFLGSWIASEESHDENNPGTMYYNWNFYENDSVLFEIRLVNNTLDDSMSNWFTFKLVDSKLIFELPDGSSIEYDYALSENKNELTVTKDNVNMTFTKVQ